MGMPERSSRLPQLRMRIKPRMDRPLPNDTIQLTAEQGWERRESFSVRPSMIRTMIGRRDSRPFFLLSTGRTRPFNCGVLSRLLDIDRDSA